MKDERREGGAGWRMTEMFHGFDIAILLERTTLVT
jgi:hypothetical protein